MVCDKDGLVSGADGSGRMGAGYRIKNKNPTQRCGDKQGDSAWHFLSYPSMTNKDQGLNGS